MQSQPTDLLSQTGGNWVPVLRVETADYSWGQLVITGEAKAINPYPLETTLIMPIDYWPWIEVRVLATSAGVPWIWFEGAAGNHDAENASFGGGSEGNTPGPIVLPFAPGEVPDVLEVYARGRAGGMLFNDPLCPVAATIVEILTVAASSRFHL
jgi:hypothetical protein